jgi:hypothetical protein
MDVGIRDRHDAFVDVNDDDVLRRRAQVVLNRKANVVSSGGRVQTGMCELQAGGLVYAGHERADEDAIGVRHSEARAPSIVSAASVACTRFNSPCKSVVR